MLPLLAAFLAFGLLGLVMIFLNRWLGPKASNPMKNRPFECGSPPLQERIPPVALPFALVAFMFLLFDVEIVFLFPWAVSLKVMRWAGAAALLGYAVLLGLGFVYAWKKGMFEGG